MVSVSCFGVRVSVMFHFMFVRYTFSSVLVAILVVFCLFVIYPVLVLSGICLLTAPAPVHCFSITFISRVLVVVQFGGPKKSPRTSI